eukprot:349615-Chlamydomonas_euryale.AAC.4
MSDHAARARVLRRVAGEAAAFAALLPPSPPAALPSSSLRLRASSTPMRSALPACARLMRSYSLRFLRVIMMSFITSVSAVSPPPAPRLAFDSAATPPSLSEPSEPSPTAPSSLARPAWYSLSNASASASSPASTAPPASSPASAANAASAAASASPRARSRAMRAASCAYDSKLWA